MVVKSTEELRIDEVNERYTRRARELAETVPDPYERFFLGRALFADWSAELRNPCVLVTW